MATARRRRGPALGFPVLLVLGGCYLLAYNFGFVDRNPLSAALILWPIVLVAIGLDIVTARASRWLAALVSLAVLGGLTMLAVLTEERRIARPPASGKAQQVNINGEGLEAARLQVRFYSGEVLLRAAEEGTPELVLGSAHTIEESDLLTHVQQSDGQANVLIRNRTGGIQVMPLGQLGPARVQRLDLALNREIPFDLTVEGSGSELDLDLTATRLEALEIGLVAGSAAVRLPQPVATSVCEVEVNLGSVLIVLPDGAQARVRVSSDLSTVSVDHRRLAANGRYYESPGYDEAEHRWDITVHSEVGSVRVR